MQLYDAVFTDVFLDSVKDGLITGHFEKAAEFCNLCHRKGIQGSTIDFLICAVACMENLFIFTVDKDFAGYKKYLPLHLL